MKILGIESSCDETAAAVVADGNIILSDVVASQEELHRKYGGVVPEIASRAHIEAILPVIDEALATAGVKLDDVDVLAVSNRPGLVGALLVGVSAAKAIAWAVRKPLVAVDHVRAHVYAYCLQSHEIVFPCVVLIASGGHTLILHAQSPTQCRILGTTADDAAGEAFDKVAAILGLGYPGGPVIDRIAGDGDPNAIKFPRSYLERGSLNFSFSGVKTSVLYYWKGQDGRGRAEHERAPLADVVASLQEAIVDVLVDKTMLAAERMKVERVMLGGGVACNSRLRLRMKAAAEERGMHLMAPPPRHCTDNAAMVAGLAHHLALENNFASLDLEPKPALIRSEL
ncbi:MAG: tRNA (adenosine(37)-N6)-threonylcarbamoyltransferase complex transferase subunit TsaD [Planctomycetes bacterium]|nr:tRNA (adenosine(37)-N6)-threonylcarbamoyltransferase complex transferase subunit TsaD [Planctomycetota bacterium]